MSLDTKPPQFPVGPFEPYHVLDETMREEFTRQLSEAPANLRAAVYGLENGQLDTKYKNWSIRQIVHHLADSHMHVSIRFRWALTEDNPTIKAYDENQWSDIHEAVTGDVEPSLFLFDGLHQRLVQLIKTLSTDQLQRTFYHPQLDETVSLATCMGYYPWHCRHHTGQILWLRQTNGWN